MRVRTFVFLAALALNSLGAQARWTVDAKPLLDMKGVDEGGTLTFASVTWATRLSNGTVVVADATGPALHFVDTQGRVRKSAGKSGQGPGDFRTVTWVGKCGGGGIFAWDFPQRRMSLFDEGGTYQSSFTFAGGQVQTTTSCNDAGALLSLGGGRRLSTGSGGDATARYSIAEFTAFPTLVSSKGDTLLKLAELVIGEIVASQGGGGLRPLGPTLHYALGRDRLWLGMSDSTVVTAYAFDGKRIGAIEVRRPPRPVSPANYLRAVDYYLGIVPAQSRSRFKSLFMEVPPPGSMPTFTGLFVDPDGLIWVNLSAPGDADTQLRAFAADGRVLANLTLPVSVNVFEIGREYVLGSRIDADDEPHLVVYRLNRSGRQ
jgi:hypothetical protein